MIIDFLHNMSHWVWISFGCLLLISELLGTAGYLLWLGISAICIGIGLSITPIAWQWQWSLFAILSVATTVLWWFIQHKKDKIHTQKSTLNQRSKSLVGQKQQIMQDIPAGKSRLHIGDGTWPVIAETIIPAGRQIEITRVDGIMLYIRKVD